MLQIIYNMVMHILIFFQKCLFKLYVVKKLIFNPVEVQFE